MEQNTQRGFRSFRKARTRTLIQLGGLIEKSGLLHRMEIMIGSDLQKDDDMYAPMLRLFGGLCDLNKQIEEDPALLRLWEIKGKKQFN
jgi:hypothetical protein